MTLGGARGFRRGCMLFCHLFRLFDVFYRRKTSNTPLWDERLHREVVFPFHSPLDCGITVWGVVLCLFRGLILSMSLSCAVGLQNLAVFPSFFSCLWEAREGLHHVYEIHYFCSSCGVVAHCLWKGGKICLSPHILHFMLWCYLVINSSRVCSSFVPVRTWFFWVNAKEGLKKLAISCPRGSHGKLACLRLPRKQLQHGLCA